MAGDLTAILSAVRTRMTALGFTATKHNFDFDEVPNSIIDKAYRIHTGAPSTEYWTGKNAAVSIGIEIYIAYKIHREPETPYLTALDDRETIEKDLLSNATILALAQHPLLFMDNEASLQKYLEGEGYLISKIVFVAHYVHAL